jgi:hypothetical protein
MAKAKTKSRTKKRCYRTIKGYGTTFCCNGSKKAGSRVKLTCRNMAKRRRKARQDPRAFAPRSFFAPAPPPPSRPWAPKQTEMFATPGAWAPPSEIERARSELLEPNWSRAEVDWFR